MAAPPRPRGWATVRGWIQGGSLPRADSLTMFLKACGVKELEPWPAAQCAARTGCLDELAARPPRRAVSRTGWEQLAAFPTDRPVPCALLERQWGLDVVAARRESDRFFDHSLTEAPGAEGVRLHAVLRDQLNRLDPESAGRTSGALLDAPVRREGLSSSALQFLA